MPLKLVENCGESGLSLATVMKHTDTPIVFLGEICNKCGKARFLHPQPYVYTCPFCRYSFQVNPVSRTKHITLLHKSEVRE